MSFYHVPRLPQRFHRILDSFLNRPDLPFADVLTEAAIQKAFDDQGACFGDDEETVYTPAITLWAFLSQVLFKGEQRSCVAAVARVIVLLVALERGPCGGNTGAYCRARAKLSEPVLRRLATEVADGCERQVDPKWLWHGRHVYLIDGTTVSMPDTPANQAKYPQHPQQPQGLGFPIARLVVLLSLATGMLKDMALGPYEGKETGETALLRPLLERFESGAILLADRYFCSYFLIASLMKRGIDFVTRIHQHRPVDFRRGWPLGPDDHLVEWRRPARPDWMDRATYERMPLWLEVREVHVQVSRPGFRVKSLVVVTTLKDAAQYTREDIAGLFASRWLVELDIRAIKITMGMDILRCKTPAMVRKEMWTCLLAYNLIRRAMLQSASGSGTSPRALSFSAALQAIAASWQVLAASTGALAAGLVEAALETLAGYTIGDRPGRVEPRAVKRRPKPHPLLTKPREQARAELLKAGSSQVLIE
jgi:putative transposase